MKAIQIIRRGSPNVAAMRFAIDFHCSLVHIAFPFPSFMLGYRAETSSLCVISFQVRELRAPTYTGNVNNISN